MKNAIYYLMTVLIWGSTWIGIKMQLGVVDPMVSVTYRFALAAVILLCWCWLKRLKMRFSPLDHLFILLQGGLLFGFNYLFFYQAELVLTSGLAAVIFSTVLMMNIVNGAVFLGSKIETRVVLGGCVGLVGIVLVFHPEMVGFSLDSSGAKGVLLCSLATLLASWGNITSARNQRKGLPIIQTNAYGMAYGALLMAIASLVLGKSFVFEATAIYIGSLVYLALFGSIIAFGCYLSLLGRIGADRAAYATLLFPIVALVISTIFEGYGWSLESLTGVALILFGNLMVVKGPGKKQVVAGKVSTTLPKKLEESRAG